MSTPTRGRGPSERPRHDAAAVTGHFAQWQRASTGRWSRVHWFRDAWPACGVMEPADIVDFVPAPASNVTCVRCDRLHRGLHADDAPPTPVLHDCRYCRRRWPAGHRALLGDGSVADPWRCADLGGCERRAAVGAVAEPLRDRRAGGPARTAN